MISRSRKVIPAALCAAVIAFALAIGYFTREFEDFGLFGILRRLEWITYDWRVRTAAKEDAPTASNLGLVFINDSSIWYLRSGLAGYSNTPPIEVGLHWPRYVYGQLIDELTQQGADVVGFDILLADLRPKTEVVDLPDDTHVRSDQYFAERLAASGRVVLAAENQLVPPRWFQTNAWSIGDIGVTRDADGVIRRTKAFEDYVMWDPIVLEAYERLDIKRDTNRIVFHGDGGTTEVIPIDLDGRFDKARLLELANGVKLPPGPGRLAPAFRRVRVWDLGLTMAAHYLGINLNEAVVVPGSHISLRGTNSVRREIPIDDQNRLRIDWSLEARHPLVAKESFHGVLDRHYKRASGQVTDGANFWRGRVVLVGSLATGNDLTDLGATPLGRESFLTMRYINIVNSMLVNRFVRQPSLPLELTLILGLGLFSGIFTWNFRAHFAALCVLLLAVLYTALALYLYTVSRYALPMVLPIGGLVTVHMALVTYRVVVEQQERRRIRSIFAKIVSPNVVNELLDADRLEVAGARREITVFFSDVRGFTEMTDESHARAEEYVQLHGLTPAAAEAYFDQQAQEILETVNLYLGTIADVVKQSEGTLDKYIGDCVMAFWGAPTPNERHAASCVRAAIEAQRAIDALNRERAQTNERRQADNVQRTAQGLPPLPFLKILTMGAGVNTGVVTLGLMGSERHVYNYTVFGRDVNLAARLEGLSGSGRILIGEATHRILQRDDPALAATCRELVPATIKGFRTPVKVFEVPWTARPAGHENTPPTLDTSAAENPPRHNQPTSPVAGSAP